jgi:hypothetical protein
MANKDKGIKASANLRRGKPSPQKGIKTGKPAWNKGLKTSLIPTEHKRLRHSMKTALNTRLKAHGSSKSYQSTFDLLGYSVEELKKHLESQFEPGMAWENYGDWHIDHVIPDSWFSYTSTQDKGFKDSWALKNLQPMWAQQNINKGNRFAGKEDI